MPVWLLSLVTSKAGRYALAIGAAIVALAVAVARIFSAGKRSAIAESQAKALGAENARKQVDVAVATGGDAERKRMLGKYERD